ncbi:dihydrolipoamide acetyltransferase family protein [Maribacter sp. 2210JD10-5]|uniref:dihydrolipoamide acetyltransferase family protein n=1 Tax=Maribacter sp. 2210JD10-5 TaxID=3386272 RepID=UPI0039BD8D83
MSNSIDVILPKEVGEEVESLVVMWYKEEGDDVEKDEILVEVQTDKAIYELPAPEDGVLTEILVKRGEVAAVGQIMAKMNVGGEAEVNETSKKTTTAETKSKEKAIENTTVNKTIKASPLVKKMAKEKGIDLTTITGSGPGGKIVEADLEKAQTLDADPDFDVVENSPIRKATAKNMLASLQNTAQLTLQRWIDVSELQKRRKKLSADASWNDWVLRAVVVALKEHPDMNAHWVDDEKRKLAKVVHLGFAVDTEKGLMVPVIKNADKLSLTELSSASDELQSKAKDMKLKSDELNGGTFTVTNLGGLGITYFTPVLDPPQVGILGVGRLQKKVTFKGENNQTMGQSTQLPLSITFDHRAVDGAPAARFLQTIETHLQTPENLI